MPLGTTIRSGFITDLIVPLAGTCGKNGQDLETIAYDTAMEVLHDFPAFIRSNPLVSDVVEIFPNNDKYIDVPAFCKEFDVDLNSPNATSGWTQYDITDNLNLLFGYTQKLVFQSALRKTKTGFESVTNPGSGVRLHGRFNIEKSSEAPGIINFIEHNETKCNVFLGVYIKATLGSSHKTLHENFKKAWNEKMKQKLGGQTKQL
jgi:hypothetical protein